MTGRVLLHQRDQVTDIVGNNSDRAVVGEAAGDQLHIVGVWVVDGNSFPLIGDVAKLVAVQIPNPLCDVLTLPFVHAVKLFLGHILSGIQQRPDTLRRLFPCHNDAFSRMDGRSALGDTDALRLIPRRDTLRTDIEAFAVVSEFLLQKGGSFAQPMIFLEIGADTQAALAVVAAACQHFVNDLLRNSKGRLSRHRRRCRHFRHLKACHIEQGQLLRCAFQRGEGLCRKVQVAVDQTGDIFLYDVP